jgi:hypothetical protein
MALAEEAVKVTGISYMVDTASYFLFGVIIAI